MNYYSTYTAIKAKLGNEIPVFFYIGQYLSGKENTSYRVPVIYIEFPKEAQIDFYGKKLMVMKDINIKIHVLSYAPFKNHDDPIQDAAIKTHEAKIREIDLLLNGWNTQGENGLKMSEQFIPNGGEFNVFEGMTIRSVVNYKTELYMRHQQA